MAAAAAGAAPPPPETPIMLTLYQYVAVPGVMIATGTGFDTITAASDGLIVLATFENRGYAFLLF